MWAVDRWPDDSDAELCHSHCARCGRLQVAWRVDGAPDDGLECRHCGAMAASVLMREAYVARIKRPVTRSERMRNGSVRMHRVQSYQKSGRG